MIKIAHRGNFQGTDETRENTPSYIEEAIFAGFDVKVDAWLMDTQWYLGNDFPREKIDISFLERPQIWTHAKNLVGYISLYHNTKAHVFWHNKDDYVFTSKGIKWASIRILTQDGVMVMPEFCDWHMDMIRIGHLSPLGICSDDFKKFK